MITNRQLFLSHLAQTTSFPLLLEIERAEGMYLYGENGEKVMDLISGIGVSNIGHRHPKVIQAIKKQADKYLHVMVYGEMVQSPQVKLVENLLRTLPKKLDNCYLVNSGSEAVEGALKLAKRFTGRAGLISCHNSYHGSTHGALSVCGNEELKKGYRPLLTDVKHITFGNGRDLSEISTNTAAIILETVQGEAGVMAASRYYFKQLRQRCDATGTLLILDEVQTGFGRTGKFWGFEHYDIVPDIVVCAKAMGGGMPIGAFIAPQHIMDVLKRKPILGHISTFGGHPVSAAAALANLNVLTESRLIEEVETKAELFKKYLRHPAILEIRNMGLLMAVEFKSFEIVKAVIDRAMEMGLLTDWFLFRNNALRLAPPLIISEAEIKSACGRLLAAVDDVLASGQRKGRW
ncbi:Acetylornithine/succinyldiaminopimelate/putrescine aminotransferase [Pricia antarctica]|uniref:Acetylornithine/succinyldiaminopimelate/putrescine aminotransferase n=1 Tax=Pricia antarctica TaxID=641691 RepID=A0A1G7BA61_9FLAO|nr:aspartate aminotransferase family protein [Pricia antarctica]SDE23994.1 Acetylornithine/succinyldiaminopimelate/putrescine aminotransferase [Pricia antarctica]